ncbi:MAG: hypothetical protein WC825_01410 [Gallionellaceae bacterium]|jgi:hypothetical protein
MKKVALTLASVLAAAAFAPEASAVPAFARQTGMACDACHFNSYPILSAFGKSFKAAGYTMMGSQGKIEGEHGLSIPAELNMAVYLQHRIQKKSGTDVAGTKTQNSGLGRIDFPDEFSLFAAGRVSEGIGSLTEIAIGSGAAGLAGTKLVFSNDLGSMKTLVVPFTVNGLGPQYGFDLFATGSTANGRPIENQQTFTGSFLGTNATAASGATLGVVSEDFHVTVTPWVQGFAASNSGITATGLGATYVRAAFTPTIAGFETGLGVQYYTGNGLKGVDPTSAGATQAAVDANANEATIIDAQAQGEVAGMPLGIYGSYGSAPASTASKANAYNGGTETKSHMGILADVGVIPHVLNLQAGLSFGKTGTKLAGSNETDNAIVIGARYKLRQNVKVAVAYSMMSGTAYDAGGSKDATTAQNAGKTLMNLILSTAF